MEENLFKNEYIMNEKLAKEICNKLLKTRIILGYIVGIFNLLMFVFVKITSNTTAISSLIIGLGCLFIAIWLPKRYSKRLLETSKLSNNNEILKSSITFNDNIKIDKGNNHSEYDYSQIFSKKETQNIILVGLKSNSKSKLKVNLIISKNGFTKR